MGLNVQFVLMPHRQSLVRANECKMNNVRAPIVVAGVTKPNNTRLHQGDLESLWFRPGAGAVTMHAPTTRTTDKNNVTDTLESNLHHMHESGAADSLDAIRRGVEKESLRIDQDGILAQTPHPLALGSTLTHPHITTDYSEALLEFVTPVSSSIEDVLQCLNRIHTFVYQNIGDEKLWVNSMPCIVRGEDSIPIAEYGSSNIGRMKNVYRRGLGYRYGKLMQAIAGIHYNFSLPDTFWDAWLPWGMRKEQRQDRISEHYFTAIRNFHRHSWLLFYLFGASPAVCKSFVAGRDHGLESFDEVTYYAPYATTLRMSRLGYHNSAQTHINICYNSLDEFVDSLRNATDKSFADYEKIGVKVDGEYRQLNTNLLQIENEYYAAVRPKRVIRSGERPTTALATRGVEYIEVRCIDLNPFVPVGIDADTMRFVDMFLLYCLFSPSPQITDAETDAIDFNQTEVSFRGRAPDLNLRSNGNTVSFQNEASKILDELDAVAEMFDDKLGCKDYSASLKNQKVKLTEPDRIPAAQIIEEMRRDDDSFVEFALRKANEHENYFKQQPLSEKSKTLFTELAERSLNDQAEIEANDKANFDEFLVEYFSD